MFFFFSQLISLPQLYQICYRLKTLIGPRLEEVLRTWSP